MGWVLIEELSIKSKNMKSNNLNIFSCLLIVSFIFLQSKIYSSGAGYQPSCEDLANIDYPQPYPNSGWNQFDVGEDQGIEGNGELKFTIDDIVNQNNIVIGLDQDPLASTNWNTIDFAFYILNNGSNNIVRVYENGVLKATLVNTVNSINGYKLRIERTDDIIEYFMNDVLEYTSTVLSTDHLYYDNSCYRRSGSEFSASQIKLCQPGPPDAKTIKVNSAYVDGKIRLRWMTTEMNIWEHALKVGYTIERITVAEGNTYLSKNERIESYVLLEEGYLPKSLSELEAATSNPNEGTLANLLVKDSNTQETIMGVSAGEQTLAKAVEQKQMRDMRYLYSHVLAEKSFAMACAMGMAYEDSTIETDKQYAYIITLSEPLN